MFSKSNEVLSQSKLNQLNQNIYNTVQKGKLFILVLFYVAILTVQQWQESKELLKRNVKYEYENALASQSADSCGLTLHMAVQ